MATRIKSNAKEGSNKTYEFTFKDSGGSSITPDSVRWTLTNKDREIINNRRHIVVTPGAPTVITLSGNDLRCTESGPHADRLLLVEGMSGGVPIVEEFSFKIECSTVYPITTTTTTTTTTT